MIKPPMAKCQTVLRERWKENDRITGGIGQPACQSHGALISLNRSRTPEIDIPPLHCSSIRPIPFTTCLLLNLPMATDKNKNWNETERIYIINLLSICSLQEKKKISSSSLLFIRGRNFAFKAKTLEQLEVIFCKSTIKKYLKNFKFV